MVADIAVRGEREAFLGERRATDVAAEALELAALVGAGDDTGVQREATGLAQRPVFGELLGNRRQRLQRERLLPAARAECDAIGDRGGSQLLERSGFDVVAASKSGVLGVAFNEASALEEAADAVRERGGQGVQLGARRRRHAAKAQRAVGMLDVDAVEDEHVDMHVEIQRATEALDQRHRACLRVLARESGLADQVSGEAAMDDAEHRAHGRRLVGEQEPKRVGHAQHPLAHGLGREDPVDEERDALGHTSCATARTEATALAAKGNEVLGVAAVAGDAQEAVLEPSAGKEILELARDVPRQGRTLRHEMRLEGRVVFLDETVGEGLLGAVARVPGRAPAAAGDAADGRCESLGNIKAGAASSAGTVKRDPYVHFPSQHTESSPDS